MPAKVATFFDKQKNASEKFVPLHCCIALKIKQIMDELSNIQGKIYEIRGIRVMLDFDLAEIYQVPTKALKQAVKRNMKRFPPDFMFELTKQEWNILRSQIVMR